jgi:hypothetical protein
MEKTGVRDFSLPSLSISGSRLKKIISIIRRAWQEGEDSEKSR